MTTTDTLSLIAPELLPFEHHYLELGRPARPRADATIQLRARVFFWRGFAQPVEPNVREAYMAPWHDPARRLPTTIGPRQLIAASS